MPTEPKLTPDEISERIVAAVGFVDELHEEIRGLLRMILDTLQSSGLDPSVLSRLKDPGFSLPVPKGKSRPLRKKYHAHHRALVVQVGAGEGDEDIADEEDGDDQDNGADKKGIEASPDSTFLAVIVRLYEPDKAKAKGFKPSVTGACLSGLQFTPTAKKQEASPQEPPPAKLAKRRFLQIFWEIEAGTKQNDTLTCRVLRGHLSATVAAIETRLLAEFDSEEKVRDFADSLVGMAETG